MTHKLNHMQNIFKAAYVVTFSVVLAACGSTTKEEKGDLTDKKAKLEKLKGDQKKISSEISELEKEIAKLDTAAGTTENVTT